MKLSARMFTVAFVIALGIALTSQADPNAKSAAPAGKSKSLRVTKPWSDLASLTDEQKEKIHDIHAKFLEERRALEKKEYQDCLALLTDDQRKELANNENNAKAGKKQKPADASGSEEKKD